MPLCYSTDSYIVYMNANSFNKQRAYSSVFTELQGENVDFCLPDESITDANLEDFTWCN